MKAALYIRVSTVYQIDKDSLPMQRKDLQNYCKLVLGIEDYEIFEDAGYSAKNTDRPAFQNMMEKLRHKEFTHVLVWKIDRISRNLSDFANMWDEFQKYDVQFISKIEQFDTSTAMGRAMLNIVMTFAQLEREMTSMRVKATMISRAEQGKWNGANVPLGYVFDEETKYPIPDETEAKLVQEMFDMYDKCHSTSKMCKDLNGRGILTKRKGRWSSKSVADTLRNPFYKGTLRYNYRQSPHGKINDESEWIIVEDNHEGIISKEQWERVNAQMDMNNKCKNETGRKIATRRTHVLAGLIRCGYCGGGTAGCLDKPRLNNWRPSYYRCNNATHNTGCTHNNYVSEVQIGDTLMNYISNVIYVQNHYKDYDSIDTLEKGLLQNIKEQMYIDPDGLNELLSSLHIQYNDAHMKVGKQENNDNALLQEIQKLESDKEKYNKAMERWDNVYLFANEDISEREYLQKKNQIAQMINDVQNQINKIIENLRDSQAVLFDSKQLDTCVLNYNLGKGEFIDYKLLASEIEDTALKEFFMLILDYIVVKDKKIIEVVFKNGLKQKFFYQTS